MLFMLNFVYLHITFELIKFTIFEGSMLKLDDQLRIKNESRQLYSHIHALFEGSQLHVPSVVPTVGHHFEKPMMGFELERLSNHQAQFHLKINRMFKNEHIQVF